MVVCRALASVPHRAPYRKQSSRAVRFASSIAFLNSLKEPRAVLPSRIDGNRSVSDYARYSPVRFAAVTDNPDGNPQDRRIAGKLDTRTFNRATVQYDFHMGPP